MVSEVTNATEEQIMWEMPLTRVGFYVAQHQKKNGVKGIERRKNYSEVIKRLRQKRKNNGKS